MTTGEAPEVRQVIEAPGPIMPDSSLLADFKQAPDRRQEEIVRILVDTVLSAAEVDLVRENAYLMLQKLSDLTRNNVRVAVAKRLLDRLGRTPVDDLTVRVAYAAGLLPYFSKAQRKDFLNRQLEMLTALGYRWTNHDKHGPALRLFEEIGGFSAIPDDLKPGIAKWMVLCYIGEPGGYGAGVNLRHSASIAD